jgi:hypothetical protein
MEEVQKEVKEIKAAARGDLVLPADEDGRKKALMGYFEDLHNLLWNQAGLSPERALEHMTFFFAYRLIEMQADALQLPQECRWSYIASLKSAGDLFAAIKKGVTSFRNQATTKPFFKSHEIQKEELVYDIVRLINRIPISMLQETDALGDIFEYMLGRGMSTMQDEGQYFTNRSICDLAFRLALGIKGTCAAGRLSAPSRTGSAERAASRCLCEGREGAPEKTWTGPAMLPQSIRRT